MYAGAGSTTVSGTAANTSNHSETLVVGGVGGVLAVVVVVVAFVPAVGCTAVEAVKMASTVLGNVGDFMASAVRERGALG